MKYIAYANDPHAIGYDAATEEFSLVVPSVYTARTANALVKANSRARVLLVDMDAVMTDYPDEATVLLDTFDLSALPFVLELDKAGVVQGRYLQL